MKIEPNKSILAALVAVLLIAAFVVASKPAAQAGSMPGSTTGSTVDTTSDQVVEFNNGALPTIPDGRNTLATNTFGVPVLITDIQVHCSSGVCSNVAILPPAGSNPPNRFHARFGGVTAEPESLSLTTGFIWKPGETITYFKTGGGALRVSFIGVKLSS
jgi:hypothetical protein